MLIRINALDAFFFRDAKPFEMGEESWADSIFPPSPSVIYGTLRFLFFIQENELHATKERLEQLTKDLKITGIFLEVEEEITDKNGKIKIEKSYLLPLMNDLVEEKESKELAFLELKDTNPISSSDFKKIPVSKARATKANGFIDTNSYSKLLKKQKEEIKEKIKTELLISEPKIGIARDNQTHANQEGKLYRVEMQRFDTQKYKNIQFVITCENLELKEGNYMTKMGGEGKIFSYSVEKEIPKSIKVETPTFDENVKGEDKIFRLCVVTPALLKNGSLPSWIIRDEEKGTMEGKPNEESNLKLELITTLLGKPVSFGGFDLKEKQPKEMNKYVPAGAVYYFKIIDGTYSQVIDMFHGKSISDTDAAQGFGIAYVGK
jgi:CRISPR-associated protein Cmr3